MKSLLAALMLAGGLLVAGVANAAVTITAAEVGSDVVFTFAGTINISGLSFVSPTAGTARAIDQIYVVNASGSSDIYSGVTTTPSRSFYSGSMRNANSATLTSGNNFAIVTQGPTSGDVYLSQGYNGSQISSSMTFTNTTILQLNLVAGTYVWTLPNDTVTLTIGSAPTPASIPSLSEWTQLMLGLMVISMIGWHFHRERSY